MMHDLTVGNGWVSAIDFWKMSPGQVWWLVESKTPEEIKSRGRDMSEIVNMVRTAKAQEAENGQG